METVLTLSWEPIQYKNLCINEDRDVLQMPTVGGRMNTLQSKKSLEISFVSSTAYRVDGIPFGSILHDDASILFIVDDMQMRKVEGSPSRFYYSIRSDTYARNFYNG